MLDWDGAVVKRLDYERGVANIYVIDRFGTILKRITGPLTATLKQSSFERSMALSPITEPSDGGRRSVIYAMSRRFSYCRRMLLLSRSLRNRGIMETILIGDIHGCSREFSALLDHVSPGRDDQLILLGDLVNKGSRSCRGAEIFESLDCVCLLGNHDFDHLKWKGWGYSKGRKHCHQGFDSAGALRKIPRGGRPDASAFRKCRLDCRSRWAFERRWPCPSSRWR